MQALGARLLAVRSYVCAGAGATMFDMRVTSVHSTIATSSLWSPRDQLRDVQAQGIRMGLTVDGSPPVVHRMNIYCTCAFIVRTAQTKT